MKRYTEDEQSETDADYALAIELLSEVGLLVEVSGYGKHPFYRKWCGERDKLLRTPRAQVVLRAVSESFITEGEG